MSPDGTTIANPPDHLLRHSVHFYDRPASLIDRVCEYVREGFRGGDAAIIICTPEHLASVDACLSARGFDVADLRRRGQYVSLDAVTTLEQFMVNGSPDRLRFSDVVQTVVDIAKLHGKVLGTAENAA